MDGTLVDTEPYWIQAEIELARAAGGPWTHEDGLTLIGQAIPKSAAQLKAKAGLTESVDEIVETLLKMVADQMLRHGIPWQPGARELLHAAAEAGIPCALVTMSYALLADVLRDALPSGIFKAVVTGDQVANGKPHPEPYLKAAEILDIDISRAVAIEDSLAGIASAQAAGARVIGVPHLLKIPPQSGLSRVNSLTEVDLATLAEIGSGNPVDLVRD